MQHFMSTPLTGYSLSGTVTVIAGNPVILHLQNLRLAKRPDVLLAFRTIVL